LPAEDRYVLEFAADAHGVSTAGLALAIVQTVRAEGLLDSLLDDREAVASDDVRPMRRRRRRGARTAWRRSRQQLLHGARRRRIERLVEVDRLPKLLANEVILCASSRSPYASRSILGNW
jgi:hypothetical protein